MLLNCLQNLIGIDLMDQNAPGVCRADLRAFSTGNAFVPLFIQVDADSLRTYGGAFTASNALALIPTDQSLAAVALRIGAPLTAEGASGQKYGCPDALTVINGKRLQLHYIAFYAH